MSSLEHGDGYVRYTDTYGDRVDIRRHSINRKMLVIEAEGPEDSVNVLVKEKDVARFLDALTALPPKKCEACDGKGEV